MTAKEIKFPEYTQLYPRVSDWSRLLLSCRAVDYSASAIVKAAEDVDARVINLNMFHDDDADTDTVFVDLRVNHSNPDAVMRSLTRRGYDVILAAGSAMDDGSMDTMKERVDELLYLINL